METHFLLLRHGETISNKTGYFQGWHDSALNENGIRQVQCAAEYLKDIPFDRVYSSDLGRAVQTIHLALKHHPDAPLELSPQLREWHLGIYDGGYQPEIKEKHPEVLKLFTRENENVQLPGGESREEFQHRIEAFFHEKALAHPGETILICTHGGVFQRLFRMISGKFADNNRLPLPDNASLSHIKYISEHDGWQLLEWNIHHYLGTLPIAKTLAL